MIELTDSLPISLPPWAPVLVGAALLAFGWVLYRIAIGLAGGVLGAAAGWGIALLASRAAGLDSQHAFIAQIAGGVIGLVAGIAAFQFLHGVAFLGTGIVLGGWGWFAGLLALREQGLDWAQSDVLLFFGAPGVALVAGLLLVWLSDYVIALAAASAGTLLIMDGLQWPWLGLPALGIFAIGAMIQCSVVRGAREEEEE